jgi:hypothetical protein
MGKLEEKRKPGRTRQGWQNNVTIDMKEIVWGSKWSPSIQDRFEPRVVLEVVMQLQVPYKMGKHLNRWAISRFTYLNTWDISLDIATRLRTVDRRDVVLLQAETRNFSLLQSVQTDYGFLTASYENVTGISFTLGKETRRATATQLRLVSRLRMCALYLLSPHMPNSMTIN